MKIILLFLLQFLFVFGYAQTDSIHVIKVHFLYGSKPARKFKGTEHKYFGGIHGGHVSIETDDVDYGFSPEGKFHIIAHKRSRHSSFVVKQTHGNAPYKEGTKVATIFIPISQQQYEQLQQELSNYCSQTPYDYAFIGMRCAAAAQDVLGQIGIVKKRRKVKNVFTTFYPKKLRRRMFKLAEQNHYTIHRQDGRTTRKWERD